MAKDQNSLDDDILEARFLLEKSMAAARQMEVDQMFRLQQFEQKQRQQKDVAELEAATVAERELYRRRENIENERLAVEQQKRILDEYERRRRKELEEIALAEAEKSWKERVIAVQQQRQEAWIKQMEDELNRITIEALLKQDSNGVEKFQKESPWITVPSAKKDVKKKKVSVEHSKHQQSILDQFEPYQKKPNKQQPEVEAHFTAKVISTKSTKVWAIPTEIYQTSDEPTPAQVASMIGSGSSDGAANNNISHERKKHSKKKREAKPPSKPLDVSVLAFQVTGDSSRVNAGEIDRHPPMPIRKKRKKKFR